MSSELVIDFLTPEEKRQFVTLFYATGNAGKALADVSHTPYSKEMQARAEQIMAEDEFVRSLMSQVTHLVANDLASEKANSATILADIRERSMDMEKPNAAVMAEVARGKVLGLYTDPKERSAEVLKLLAVDQMSDEQLGSVLESIKRLPKDTRRYIALMIYDPEVEDEDDMRRVTDVG